MEQWHRQFIRCLFHYSASRLRIEEAFVAKHQHIPQFLYKYREFNAQHLDALSQDILYMSSPDRFNDLFDTTIFFDQSRFFIEDLSVGECIRQAKALDSERQTETRQRQVPIKKPIRYDDRMYQATAKILVNEPNHVRKTPTSFVSEGMVNVGEDLRNCMNKFFRTEYSVLSLSADPASILMWSHYSGGHQGFCIAYDFKALAPDDLRRRMCYPVLYREKKTDATRYLADTGGADFNSLFGLYMCLMKSEAWSYEQEWRIIYPIGREHANRKLEMPKP